MSQDQGEGLTDAAGTLLSAARERAGLTLHQAAEHLHLDAPTVQALESGRYQSLGAPVFVRGHLRRYAAFLGIPAAQIESAIGAAAGCNLLQPDLRRISAALNAPPAPNAALSPKLALIGAIALVLLGLIWWAMRAPRLHHPQPSTTSTTQPAVGATAAEQPAMSAPTLAAPLSGQPTEAAAASAQGLSAENGAGALPRGHVRLQLLFNEDSWAEIYDGNGSRLMSELGAAGSRRRLEALAPLRILLGNPEGVTLSLDGHPATLAAQSDNGIPRRFSLDGGGRVIEVRAGRSTAAAPTLQP